MPENGSVNGGAGRDTGGIGGSDRSDDNRGGAREDRESFDRAMDNANRPDRAPAAAPESTTVADGNEDESRATDQPDDRSGGFLDGLAETLSAPPTDAEGNLRSTSPVADRLNGSTVSYSLDDLLGPAMPEDPGLTAAQSATLADTAAVMNGYAFSPGIPSTADLALASMHGLGPAPIAEQPGFLERAGDAVVDTGKLAGGVAVGAFERAGDLITSVPDAAWEGVNMVNDAAGTVLDTAVGWTGIDLFEGHAQRNAARGQAMIDGITGLPGQIAEGWERFDRNWESGNYYDAGRQIGSVGLDVATVAVPASRIGALGRVDDVVPAARTSTPELDRVRRDIDEAGAVVLTDADPDVRDYMDNAARRQGLSPDELPAVTVGDNIMVRQDFENDVVTLSEELEHVRQQQDGRVSVGAEGYDTRVELEIEARENILESGNLSRAERDQIQREIDTIRDRGYY